MDFLQLFHLDTPVFIFLCVNIVLALGFDYINGFHDAANAIATVVGTRVLTPKVAVLFGAVLNLLGALAGTQVASMIGKGIVDPTMVTMPVLSATLLGAIIWNLITWYYGLPSSSSHALIGALIGAVVAHVGGWYPVQLDTLGTKVLYPMILSPAIGIVTAYVVMVALTWLVKRLTADTIQKVFGKCQLLSAGFMAYSHGSNDAQKSMGIIALAVSLATGQKHFEVHSWIVVLCAFAMGLGTLSGGWRIIRTMGSRVSQLKPIHGCVAETTAALVIHQATAMGIPLSTTHVITTSILGVGAAKRWSAVKWGVVGNILWAWILTIPASALIAFLVLLLLEQLLPQFR
jgi:PiT family inorganic phosphate transporter